jgi:Protein of unknown function (DUF3037)
MVGQRHLGLFLLRYVPSPMVNDSVNIGLVLLEQSESARIVIDARITTNWQPVRTLDPNADVDLLYAAACNICEQLKEGNAEEMLQRIEDSFSNAIQLSSCIEHCRSQQETDIDALAARYL